MNQTVDSNQAGILAVVDQEASAIAAGDIKAYTAILADDAVFMPPSTLEKKGAELRRWLDEFLQSVTIQFLDYTHVEMAVVADLAYHVFACGWRVTPKAGGESRVLRFKGLQILRRQDNGEWKLTREIWNLDPAE